VQRREVFKGRGPWGEKLPGEANSSLYKAEKRVSEKKSSGQKLRSHGGIRANLSDSRESGNLVPTQSPEKNSY